MLMVSKMEMESCAWAETVRAGVVSLMAFSGNVRHQTHMDGACRERWRQRTPPGSHCWDWVLDGVVAVDGGGEWRGPGSYGPMSRIDTSTTEVAAAAWGRRGDGH